MKRLAIVAVLLAATTAHADPPNFSGIEDYKKVQPTLAYCWNTDHLEPCPVGDVSGSTVNIGSAGTIATESTLSTVNGKLPALSGGKVPTVDSTVGTNTGTTATNTTSLDAKTPVFCTSVPLGAAWNANGSETDAAATLTGICASGTCKRLIVRNWDTANSVMVQFNSSTGTAGVCINPASAAGQPTSVDSSLWVAPSVGVTNVYRTTTGTTSCPTAATVGAAHMDLIGCQ